MSAVMAQPLKQAGIEVIAQAPGQADVLTPAGGLCDDLDADLLETGLMWLRHDCRHAVTPW